ncbi:MAG TPA: TetR/AcrR family transcriptional regulator [Acidimicrobiales bacterium]|nr:TetR/AcrR family transcriptional regulator [Acidimicrobiales bacterium]
MRADAAFSRRTTLSVKTLRQDQPPERQLDLGGPAPLLDGEATYLLPPRLTAEGTLRRMLEAALIRFGERGYHAVPVRDIARGAGVRASSMYEHRASKEELLVDLMMAGHEEHRDWLATARRESGDDPRDQMRAIVHAHVRFHATYPLLARVCNRELGSLSPARLDAVLRVRNAAVDLIRDAIERGVGQGVFRVPDVYLAAAAIGAIGIRVAEWYTPESGFGVEEVADSYALFALRLLGDGEHRSSGASDEDPVAGGRIQG